MDIVFSSANEKMENLHSCPVHKTFIKCVNKNNSVRIRSKKMYSEWKTTYVSVEL